MALQSFTGPKQNWCSVKKETWTSTKSKDFTAVGFLPRIIQEKLRFHPLKFLSSLVMRLTSIIRNLWTSRICISPNLKQLHRHLLHSESVTVWCAISPKILFCPVICQKFFMPRLNEKDLGDMWQTVPQHVHLVYQWRFYGNTSQSTSSPWKAIYNSQHGSWIILSTTFIEL